MKNNEKSDSGKQTKSRWPLIITGFIIAALVVSYFVLPGFQEGVKEAWDVLSSGDRNKISEWVKQFGFWGPLLIVLFMIVQMFLLVVNVVALMLVAIIAYGSWWGSIIAVAAVVVASTVGYLIGLLLGPATVDKLLGHKTSKKVQEEVERYGIWAIMVARISPFLSNDAVSFIAGITRMNYLKFMGATLAGIIPLTVLLAWLGEDFDRLKSGLIWISVISLAALIGFYFYDKRKRKKTNA